ncbi:hypothetical protein [Fulvivirga lutea]|uniref:Uncharacterized protein n=1 Tax=Fulvivirga lutea TaxID=2810512 RepID=A0A974WHS9_9BACT|nr:hypothetical protein [Fulvivirga lutea]QSE97988.1 hypothetical protein JR347_02595 [Fulvivirga lutea]
MKYLLTIIYTTINIFGCSQTIDRMPNESPEQFVERTIPDTLKLAHSIIESTEWSKDSKAIIAFYGYDQPDANQGFNTIFGYIYLPVSKDSFKRIELEPIYEDAGLPEIISIFYVNADNDTPRELGVLCRYWTRSYEHMGHQYYTFIYDNPDTEKGLLEYDQKLFNHFSGCDCDFREGESTKAAFKTVFDVKTELKKLGY